MIGYFLISAGIVVALASPAAAKDSAVPRIPLRNGVTLEISHLKRLARDNVVELRFKVVNATDHPTSLKDLGIGFAHQLGQIALIDFDARKKYGIGHAGNCLCSSFADRDGGTVQPHSTR